jgi:hypothetical protein
VILGASGAKAEDKWQRSSFMFHRWSRLYAFSFLANAAVLCAPLVALADCSVNENLTKAFEEQPE